MKKLDLPFLNFTYRFPDLVEVSDMLERKGMKTILGNVNWPAYPYKPDVQVSGGYTEDELVLKYRVQEKYIRAVYTQINDPVHKDSCVEFFISSGNGFYYNFEFNCIGTVHAGYGKQREGRELLSEEDISSIRTSSILGTERIEVRQTEEPWELTAAIPFSIFKEEKFTNPGGKIFTGNIYKCGDELPVPHFLSWNPIGTQTPDFHRPEFFGSIEFLVPVVE